MIASYFMRSSAEKSRKDITPDGARLSTGRLTPGRGRRSVRKTTMIGTTLLRPRSWQAAAVSLVTVVALVVAPSCAPLCAAQMCSQAPTLSTSEKHCHASASMHNDVPQIHAVQNCSAPELAAAALSSVNKGNALKEYRSAASGAAPYPPSQDLPAISTTNLRSCCANAGSLRRSDSFLATIILRI